MRQYAYDLEDRIARQEDPDGTITRLLFDSNRRPTKIFKGSGDDCSDWFPRIASAGTDDMVLVEQRLYNDGHKDCEANPVPAANPQTNVEVCQGEDTNDDFPNDAGKLVRVRRFTDNAEPCSASYDAETRSRDTQYEYDWRGRQVITKEVAVEYADGTVATPFVISATIAIFDNLDRPMVVATFGRTDDGTPTGGDPAPPTVSEIEGLEAEELAVGMSYENWVMNAANSIGGRDPPPTSYSTTFYDERGRVYETRTFDPANSDNYTVARTFRDDLDRVTKQVSPGGTIENEYDSLGRVVKTSFRSKDDAVADHELTRSERSYDAVGNVLFEKHYDRKPDKSGDLHAPGVAIITYTYNWYDRYNKRLVATANYGTNAANGYTTNAEAPLAPDYPPDLSDPTVTPPEPPTWDGTQYSYGGTSLTDAALVTRYGYDMAGRRIWVQDHKGIVTRTWFDLLGRTQLVAENWKDFDANHGPLGGGGIPTDLTPAHSGPIRYTAHHYTRGGLLDMMAAIIPTAEAAQITPSDIAWNDDDATTDFAATGIDTTAGLFDVQATRFLYGADVVNESNHTVDISNAPNLVAAIHYPNKDTGAPDGGDALTFKYTIGDKVAQRTDQRGVTLDYYYGECPDCAVGTTGIPHDALAEVGVAYPSPMPADDALDDGVAYLAFDRDGRGQLTTAKSFGPPTAPVLLADVTYAYDSLGNLASETLDPGASPARTVSYDWAWVTPLGGLMRNRLKSITYPYQTDPATSRTFNYTYDDGVAGTWYEQVGRMTGLALNGGDPIIHYATTGGGRNITQTWGAEKIKLNYAAFSELDRFGRIKTMDFVNASGTIHKYEYGYDANGNRTYARIEQKGHPNDRSYLYQYDNLNRLVDAGRGKIDLSTAPPSFDMGITPTVSQWQLDLLGNWSNATAPDYAHHTFVDSDGDGEYDATETTVSGQLHGTDKSNRIGQYDAVDSAGTTTSTEFYHDAAGNLVLDDEHFYKYDAWNRVSEVHSKFATDEQSVLMQVVGGVLTGTPEVLIAKYKYDAIGRRINKQVFNSGTLDTVGAGDFFYYDGHRVIEHHKDDGTGNLSLHRQYVYGLNYINELAAFFDAGAAIHYVLQDGNYNVVGVTDDAAGLVQQISYTPYGKHGTIEDGNGNAQTVADLLTQFGYGGMVFDPETGHWHAIYRDYTPEFGRWLQVDPNETALVLGGVLLRNAQNAMVAASLSPGAQYNDGIHLYQYAGANPITGRDPSGLFFWLSDPFAEVDDIIAQMTAERIVAAQETLWGLEQGARIAGAIAFQGLLSATVPGAALYFSLKGLAASIEDIGANGLTVGNALMASASLIGVGSSGLRVVRQANKLSGYLSRTRYQYRGAPNWYNRAVSASQKFRIPSARMRHITRRHGPNSLVLGKSKFDAGVDIRTLIRRTVNNADELGTITPNPHRGVGGWLFELDQGRKIGTTVAGTPATRVRVVLTSDGNVWTAFPVP